MFTVISTAIGFFSSFLPSVIGYFQDKQDKTHELALMDKQNENLKQRHSEKMSEIEATADIAESKALYTHDAPMAGTGTWASFWNGVSKSVRPVVTYIMVFEFVLVKCALVYILLTTADSSFDIAFLDQVWDQETKNLFAAILSFWFGHRAVKYFMGRGK